MKIIVKKKKSKNILNKSQWYIAKKLITTAIMCPCNRSGKFKEWLSKMDRVSGEAVGVLSSMELLDLMFLVYIIFYGSVSGSVWSSEVKVKLSEHSFQL